MAKKDYSVNVGYPFRTKNLVQPLINGEKAWEKVYEAIIAAKKSIHLCFWGLEGDLELIRKKEEEKSNPDIRKKYTLYNLLYEKSKSGVKVRILIWDSILNAQQQLVDALISVSGSKRTFEVIYQPHPDSLWNYVSIWSWHQKNIIIDDEIAFVGGMNAKGLDWDTSDHHPINLRRSDYNLTGEQRKNIEETKNYKSLNKPRHDYMVYLKGEVAFDVQSNFAERWNFCLDKKYLYSKKATKVVLSTKNTSNTEIKAQIVRTFPATDKNQSVEEGIKNTYINAIRLAEKYIYIEDQYFRSEIIAKTITEAIENNKNLKILIATPPDYLFETDNYYFQSLSNFWTSKSFEIIKKVLPNFVFFFFQTTFVDKSGKRIFVPVNLHAKLMIVDDEWYTIGSANLNDRSLTQDGELNISVQDGSAKELRKKIFSIHLNQDCPDDFNLAYKLWVQLASDNNILWKNNSIKTPKGSIYAYNQKGITPIRTPSTWI
ncbi:MAG: phosphatidylserine/phosphatidylglycerophosphate/cardiolipin synthase family protein [Pyrinomonadaceae bacterium]